MRRRFRRSDPHEAESVVMPTEHEEMLSISEQLLADLHRDVDKLERDGATRGDLKIIARAVKELRYAFKVFKPYRRQRKITVFGSARTPADNPAFQTAVEFGRRMAEEGWFVVTGAGGGIMEAAHVGAGRDQSMGLNIMLPFEQSANPIIKDDAKLVNFKYFFTRKLLFVKEVHAIALFPGGFGTLDEAFEVFTLVQTGKRDLMPMICVDQPGGSYWTDMIEYVNTQLLKNGLISPADLSLIKVTDDLDDAIEEIMQFYCVYNSMRYVRGKLVLRLHVEPSDEFVERLNDEFSDLLAKGRIVKTVADEREADDEHLMDLPRLAFDFDRRETGRLREMVDLINEEYGDCVDGN